MLTLNKSILMVILLALNKLRLMVISLALNKSGAVILFKLRLMINFIQAEQLFLLTLNQAKINGYFANR